MVVMFSVVKLGSATCVYKCSLYTVGGYIYKLGKFVMTNWDVAGINSEVICNQIVYSIYSGTHKFR